MLDDKQVKEIKEHLEKAQNPLFFFDNDADGLCSFLLLARHAGRGKGVAIKSFPGLDQSYARKLYELKPDYVFVLDKPIISQEFIAEAKKLNLPFVWIDHHDVEGTNLDYVNWYNPLKSSSKSNEPVTYLAYKVVDKKQDLWLAACGCIGDSFLPDFMDEFSRQYPELWGSDIKTASQALYETEIGKISRILSFALKDRTSNVVRMQKFLMTVSSPQEILIDDPKNHILFRFNQIDRKYQKLIQKAKRFASREKMIFFQYGGDLSISSDISNELAYRFPSKVIVVAYVKGAKANLSLRGRSVKGITEKAIEGLQDATGGGHENATGAKVHADDLDRFRKRVEEMVG